MSSETARSEQSDQPVSGSEQPPSQQFEIDENTSLSDLTPSQLIYLNQNALNDLIPQRPLIEDVEPISLLRAEYESGSANFLKQIDWLSAQGFRHLRRARGDGDCFYRALGFAFIEQILQASEKDIAVASALSLLDVTLDLLEAVGFQKIVYEDFYEELCNVITKIFPPDSSQQPLTSDGLMEIFQLQDPPVSNCIVAYLRLLTSAQLRLNEDEYLPFLFHPELGELMPDVRAFCENFVEGSGKEADHVQMTALCTVLRLNLKVAYLDGRMGTVDFVEFRNDLTTDEHIMLLYRPGHYDILIKDSSS
ncbi:hypothetical protein APHAL10511_002439 [Amanita phalloides]|nr:hypothetical protein APHAL10511_002439 [Amanita phalloides]